jgi:pilus assembly protein CpaB
LDEGKGVSSRVFIMAGLAAICGIGAVVAGNAWLSKQQPVTAEQPQQEAINLSTVVVAAEPLRFGTELASSNLKEIKWPSDAIPKGAFLSVDELLTGEERVALAPIEVNEPILGPKITGEGEKATLSRLVQTGYRAVTVRVNDVAGVAGFLLPGDYVDVMMTRAVGDESYASMVVQNMRVLAIDQDADERRDEPTVVKAITLEADPVDAQKITLAQSVGTLSLTLRRAGQTDFAALQEMSLSDLAEGTVTDADAVSSGRNVEIWVIRPEERTSYKVPRKKQQ